MRWDEGTVEKTECGIGRNGHTSRKERPRHLTIGRVQG